MKFVKGVPFQGCEEPTWYLYVDSSLESYNLISVVMNNRIANIVFDPHNQIRSDFCRIAVGAATKLQLSLLSGERDGWYMNQNGGMCPDIFDISEECEFDNWPEQKRIVVSRWPNGSH